MGYGCTRGVSWKRTVFGPRGRSFCMTHRLGTWPAPTCVAPMKMEGSCNQSSGMVKNLGQKALSNWDEVRVERCQAILELLLEGQGLIQDCVTVPLQMGANNRSTSYHLQWRTTASSTMRATYTGIISEWQNLWVSHIVVRWAKDAWGERCFATVGFQLEEG